MNGNKLKVIEERVLSQKEQLEIQTRTRLELAWKEKLDHLDPTRTPYGQERLSRSLKLLESVDLEGMDIVDLGCGNGALSAHFQGASITAVDVADEALQKCPQEMKRIRACLPYCRLPEESFDGVLLADVIAEIEPHLYRLLLSEVSMLMKRDAFFLCSTELDIQSEDAADHFLSLLRTEFELIEVKKSYHRLYIYLRRCLDAPMRFLKAGHDEIYRREQLAKRNGILRLWFYCNSLKWVAYLWRPFVCFKKVFFSRSFLLFLERVSEILWGEGALTHIIVLCKRKSLHPV